MTNPALHMFKQQAELLYKEYGVKYSDKDPAVAAWMLDTMDETTDSHLKDLCAAGLMCRYWSVFTTKKCGVEVDYDMKVSYGFQGIQLALEYKAWQNPKKAVNADQAVKQCIHTVFLRENYLLNLDKAKANNFMISMDEEVNESFGGDGKVTLGEYLPDEEELDRQASFEADEAAISLVQSYINKKRLVEAIILDTIAFNDVNKETKKVISYTDTDGNPKKYTQVYKEFWPFRCVQILGQLPDTYATYFGKKYQFNPAEFDKAFAAIRGATNQKLYKYLDRTLVDARSVMVR